MGAERRIVIIDPAFLGDVVFDAPLVARIRAVHADAFIGLVVRPPAEGIARAIAGLDRVHVFDKRNRDRGLRGVRRVARELRGERYDTALIPHPSPRSAMLAVAARIPRRVGSTKVAMASWMLTEHRRERAGDTFVAARLRLFEEEAAAVPLRGTMSVAPGSRGSLPRIGLVLGSQWPTKRWAPERARELVAVLDPDRFELVLIGSAEERPLFEALGPLPRAIDAIGTTIDQMIAALASCDLVIAGDTGPLHVARALGVPVVALFGPTPESRHTFDSSDRVLSVALDCRPCSAHGGLVCPEGHHRCMKDLAAPDVVAAIGSILAERAK